MTAGEDGTNARSQRKRVESQIRVLGEWPEPDDQPEAQDPPRVVDGANRGERRPRRRRGQWRPTTVLTTLIVIGLALVLLDLSGGPTQAIRSAGHSIGGGVQEWANTAVGPVRGLPQRSANTTALTDQIAALQARNNELETRQAAIMDAAATDANSKRMRKWAAQSDIKVLPSHVVASAAGIGASNSVTLDAGSLDGVAVESAVVADGGLVGRIVEVGPQTSTLQLMTDPENRIWSRTADSRAAVVVEGTGSGLSLGLVDQFTKVKIGQQVNTLGSPGARPYPRGLPIGEVTAINGPQGSLERDVVITPVADLTGLDIVGIVLETDRDR
ncbi:MAG: rod shape-determining protein MreC [Actinomycetia bacterium]|nr:rod shape-determining protein MreC [Actinomycetes bacterium]